MIDTKPVLATLIPVLNRPRNVVPLVESWLASGTPGRLVFIVEVDDVAELQVVEAVTSFKGVDRLEVVDAHTWPEKINVGIQTVDADWYLCAADDVRFIAGWWAATKKHRDDPEIGVIGTNDSFDGSGNPRVWAGDHTVHPLVRQSYARGPNLDGGPFCVEDVKHWFSDDLIVAVAKYRKAWAYCPGAVIEHLHPFWRTKEIAWDDTYAHGESTAPEDQQRAQEWANTWIR